MGLNLTKHTGLVLTCSDRPDPTQSGPNVATTPSVEADNLLDDVSLNLENPEILNDLPSLDINVSDVIAQMSNEPVAGPSGMHKENSLNSSNTNVNLSGVRSQTPIISTEAVAGPSPAQIDNCFLIESVRPLPKAQPRAQLNRNRTRKSAILTDTPEKQALEEIESNRNLKRKKPQNKDDGKKKKQGQENDKGKGKGKSKGKGKEQIAKRGKEKETLQVEKAKKRILEESSDSAEDEYFCIICGVSYNEDTFGADWVQCISCKQWAQSGCIRGNTVSYVCQNCDSDDEYE